MNFFKGLFNGFLISFVLWGIIIFLVITLSSCTNTSEYLTIRSNGETYRYIPGLEEQKWHEADVKMWEGR